MLKKKILAILLAALCVTNICACDNAEKKDNECEKITHRDVEDARRLDTPDVTLLYGENDTYYIYIKEWDEYRKVPWLPNSYVNNYLASAFIKGDVADVAVHESGKHRTVITTYRFHKDSDEVEENTVDMEIHTGETIYRLINLFDENKGYFLYIQDGMSTDIVRYETTDGGKTWYEAETLTLGRISREYPVILKLVTKEVGIVSYRYVSIEDLCYRTYLTMDGGKSWSLIGALPYPFDIYNGGYTEVHDFEKINDEYVLTVKVSGSYTAYIYFKSKDLVEWTICEPK